MKYNISFELFKEVNVDLQEDEIKFCFDSLKYETIINTFFFKCFDYARSKEMFLNAADYQHYHSVSIKDYEMSMSRTLNLNLKILNKQFLMLVNIL